MSRIIAVSSIPDGWEGVKYNLFIATVGYEQRARYVGQMKEPIAEVKAACGFQSQQVLEYDINRAWFESNSFQVEHVSELEYRQWLTRLLDQLSRNDSPKRVLVDISSVTRVRLAILLITLWEWDSAQVTVHFVYSLAAFTPPPKAALANSHVGPVTSEFAGWWEEPDRGLVAVVGLGYEEDKALGAVEYLQAAEVWTFIPTSVEGAYHPALVSANRTLLSSVPSHQQIGYRVQDPFECFANLESLVYGLSQTKNAVLVPFGPKIFGLCSLLVGMINFRTPIWRVSAEGQEPAVNRQASGSVYGLQVMFGARNSAIAGRQTM